MRRLILASLLIGCGSPPTQLANDFAWQAALAELPEAVLSVCGDDHTLHAVGGTGTRGFIATWRSDHWQERPLPSGSGVLWWCAVGQGAAWAAGEGTLLQLRDASWRAAALGELLPADAVIYGVWPLAGGDMLAVGGLVRASGTSPILLALRSGVWRDETPSDVPAALLYKVWGSGEVSWAVGEGGLILRGDRDGWHPVESPTSSRLIAVWGAGPDEVYAVGGDSYGEIVRFDGRSWSAFAATSEALSGVWTAPGRPLFVGGNRGFLARFRRDAAGVIVAGNPAVAAPTPTLDVHGLFGSTTTVVAAATDLLGGGDSRWRGTILTHGAHVTGSLERVPMPDAGPDAIADAGPDAGPDAGSDAGGGPAAACRTSLDCQAGLECWPLVPGTGAICTESCTSAADCGRYGPTACCTTPGAQTLETVCIPGAEPRCTNTGG